MSASLILASCAEYAHNPYFFKSTNTYIYSFEEALYHCFSNWRYSQDEYFSDEFILWIKNELGLCFIASEIEKLKCIKKISEKILKFLTLIYYFNDSEIDFIRKEILKWENKSNAEKYKEKGDRLAFEGFYDQALVAYLIALKNNKDDEKVLNNIGVCYMKGGNTEVAAKYFENAYIKNKNNKDIYYNLIEAYINSGNINNALKFLKNIKKDCTDSEIFYFNGEIAFKEHKYIEAIENYENAISLNNDKLYIIKLSEVYLKLRKYDMALNVLDKIKHDDIEVLIKKSAIYVENNNLHLAIRSIEKALTLKNDSELWRLLASYYRMDYDLNMAEKAILKALGIDSESKEVNLEYAKIKKAQGKLRDYQIILDKILNSFKKEYRQIYF